MFPECNRSQQVYVLLTVQHPVTTLGKWPTWWAITLYNTFTIIIIIYMFRAALCSSSGGQIVLIQHLVSSHSVGGRSVCRLRCNVWNLHTGRSLTRCYINTCTDWPPDDQHKVARNMYRKIIKINVLYRVNVHQVGHLSRLVHRKFWHNLLGYNRTAWCNFTAYIGLYLSLNIIYLQTCLYFNLNVNKNEFWAWLKQLTFPSLGVVA